MSLHVGGRGPGHLVRTGAFYPSALVALDFQLQEYRTGAGSYYIRDLSALVGWSFTRTSTQTALNSSGAVVSFASGVPAITDLGLLIEEARTNLLLWSTDYTNAVWPKINSGTGSVPVVTPAAGTAPDGTLTAQRVQLNAGAGGTLSDYSGLEQIVTGSALARTTSIWIKSFTGTAYTVALRDAATGGATTLMAVTAAWQRLNITSTTTNPDIQIILRGTVGTSASADILLWNSQNEAGSFATSDILTTSATVTRAASVPSLSNGIALTTLPFSVSVAVGGVPNAQAFPALQGVTGGSGLFVTSSNLVQLFASVPGVLNTPNTITLGVPFKAAYGVDALGRSVVLNGGTVASDSGVQTNGATVYIGNDRGTGSFLNGYMRRLVLYPSRLSNAQLQALTQ